MILKPPSSVALPSDPRLRAGLQAERQMAHYLNRAFGGNDEQLFILNEIRIIDPEQPEQDGAPGVCQIDHLAIHRWGAFIIESKSVTEKVIVQNDGAGGDEWMRTFRGRTYGIKSPIKQAERQGTFLRALLNRHKTELLGTVRPGLRSIAKAIYKTDQRSFRSMPIQIIVAFSDSAIVDRPKRWTPATETFEAFACKADNVEDKIRQELKKHKDNSRLLGDAKNSYGLWAMRPGESRAVAEFLLGRHTPKDPSQHGCAASATSSEASRSTANPAPPNATASKPTGAVASAACCKSCGGSNLTARWGRYGYYWKCVDCSTNTAMPTTCSVCGTVGNRGQTVRIRKDGDVYLRACDSCGMEERIWTQPAT